MLLTLEVLLDELELLLELELDAVADELEMAVVETGGSRIA